jgi:CRP-like cAMP-binding protein
LNGPQVEALQRTLEQPYVVSIALLIPDGRRTATATALSDLVVLVFTRTEFTQLMTGLPTVAHKILHEATRRLIENSEAC